MIDLTALEPCRFADRVPALRRRLGDDDVAVDALLCTDLVSIRYLTGFTGSSAHLLVEPDRLLLVTDGRYQTQAGEQLAAAGVDADVEITRQPLEVLTPEVERVGRLGLEADSVTWAAHQRYVDAFDGTELVATAGLVAELRVVKDPGEIARLDAAAAIADQALRAVQDRLIAGVAERDFALALDHEMVRLGAAGRSFETIVASGANGAKPHARPTAKPFDDGDLVVIDFGALVDGYHSDMTRTLAVGELAAEQVRMVEVVTAAQAAGVAAVRPGVETSTVDAACREVIAAAGWEEAFTHGTGHGIGLVIHEAPRLSTGSEGVLAVGHCVTVEPGVYVPDLGGVRVEDSVVVTDDGCRALTRFPKLAV